MRLNKQTTFPKLMEVPKNEKNILDYLSSLYIFINSLIIKLNILFSDIYVDLKDFSDRILFYAGTPEGNVTANPGTICLNTNGGTGTTLYIKETGTGNTGWVAK